MIHIQELAVQSSVVDPLKQIVDQASDGDITDMRVLVKYGLTSLAIMTPGLVTQAETVRDIAKHILVGAICTIGWTQAVATFQAINPSWQTITGATPMLPLGRMRSTLELIAFPTEDALKQFDSLFCGTISAVKDFTAQVKTGVQNGLKDVTALRKKNEKDEKFRRLVGCVLRVAS